MPKFEGFFDEKISLPDIVDIAYVINLYKSWENFFEQYKKYGRYPYLVLNLKEVLTEIYTTVPLVVSFNISEGIALGVTKPVVRINTTQALALFNYFGHFDFEIPERKNLQSTIETLPLHDYVVLAKFSKIPNYETFEFKEIIVSVDLASKHRNNKEAIMSYNCIQLYGRNMKIVNIKKRNKES